MGPSVCARDRGSGPPAMPCGGTAPTPTPTPTPALACAARIAAAVSPDDAPLRNANGQRAGASAVVDAAPTAAPVGETTAAAGAVTVADDASAGPPLALALDDPNSDTSQEPTY
uniref:Uncharacterized protein n=1 Tax=Bicosoecida sp. CB-2014 TaxID=1486930 RepID=A0A7S1C772_9STRA